MAEPDWTKPISSGTVCNWFFFFFYVHVTFSVIIFGMIIYMLITRGIFKSGIGYITFFSMIAQLVIAATNALFHYLICDRALKPSGQ